MVAYGNNNHQGNSDFNVQSFENKNWRIIKYIIHTIQLPAKWIEFEDNVEVDDHCIYG